MIREIVKRCTRPFGYDLISTERLGVHPELDLARLTVGDPLKTIFDVGGNFGQTALRFAAAFPHATILTFEPVPESFTRLVHSTRKNKRVKPFNAALGDTSGTIKLNVTPNPGSNTLLHNPTTIESINVSIDTIDAVAAANGVTTIDLLKIDVEGYELQVLRGASKLLARQKIRYIFDLHKLLEHAGFCFVNYYAESFGCSNGCALGNALYGLRSKLPKSVSGRVRNIH